MRMRIALLLLVIGCFSARIVAADVKKCRDAELVRLAQENCEIVRSMGAPSDACKGFNVLLEACATKGVGDQQIAKWRANLQLANQDLKKQVAVVKEQRRNEGLQVRDDYTQLKKICQSGALNAALDEYVGYTSNYKLAIEYLKICRDENGGKLYSDSLAAQIRAGMRTVRFKNKKPPHLQPYIAACKDIEIRNAAEATLAELTALKYRGADKVLVAGGYSSLEAVLFQLERHTKTENLEKLNSLKQNFLDLQRALEQMKYPKHN